jgi:FSR family fosmidomycin resistance protein-like MFS transporter
MHNHADSHVIPNQPKNHQRFFLAFFPLGHLAVDWGGSAVLLLASAMALAMDLSALQVGLLLTTMGVGAGLMYAPAGLLGDRIRCRGLLLLVSFWWVTIGYLAASFAPGYWSVLILLTLAVIGAAAWHPVATGVMVEQMAGRKALALGVHNIGGALAGVLAPLSVGFLLTHLSWQNVLQVSVLPPLLIGIFMVWWWRRIPPSRGERIGKTNLGVMWGAWRTPLGITVAGMAVACTMAFVALEAMTPLFLLREQAYSTALTGLVFSAMLAGGAVASPIVGRASDVAGRRSIAVAVLAGSGLAGLVAAFASDGLLLISALVVAGTLIVSVRPVMLAAALEVAPGRETTALGLAFSIMDGIGGLGAVTAGAIGSSDLRLAIAFAAAMSLVSMVFALALPSTLPQRKGDE